MALAMSQTYVRQSLKRLGNYRVEMAQVVALDDDPDEISGALLLALGLRESGLQNINNREETDHGCFQISERYHGEFLRSQPGCPAGSWRADPDHSAIENGYCPRYTPALVYALDMLRGRRLYAKKLGIPDDMVLRFALAAYNAGAGGATAGWRAGSVDKYTTGGDYSQWVIANRTVVNQVLHRDLPAWVVTGS